MSLPISYVRINRTDAKSPIYGVFVGSQKVATLKHIRIGDDRQNWNVWCDGFLMCTADTLKQAKAFVEKAIGRFNK